MNLCAYRNLIFKDKNSRTILTFNTYIVHYIRHGICKVNQYKNVLVLTGTTKLLMCVLQYSIAKHS